MKKVLMGILSLIMILGLVGCSSTPADGINTAEPTKTEKPVETENSTAEENYSWELSPIIDEFGDDTGRICLKGIFTGTFSNTATSNSDMVAVIFYSNPSAKLDGSVEGGFYFRLLEYGDHSATYFSNDKISVALKIDDDVYRVDLQGNPPNGDINLNPGNRYDDKNKMFNMLYEALCSNKHIISCSITIGNSKYNFKIDGNGFKEQEENGWGHF